jgi:hypothetical protein
VLDRRQLLRTSRAAALGISSLALPSAAAAASPDGDLANVDPPRSLTVDDTLAPDAGDDVAFRIRATTATGTLYDDSLQVTLAVTVDDGTDGGAGSPATGTSIEGSERTQHTVTATAGTVDLSVDLPGAGTYLIRVSASPAAVNQPDGVTVALTVA